MLKHSTSNQVKKSFCLFVIVPSILISLYLIFIASDRYVSGAGFTVRNMSTQTNNDFLGSITGLVGNGTSSSDSYIIVKFLESRDLLQSLMNNADFLEIYGRKDIDSISRMSYDLEIEKRLKSWNKFLKSNFNPSSGIIHFEVQAFRAEDAQLMATLILEQVKILTNELSVKARQDSMYYAEVELEMAEKRLVEARTNLKLFRNTTKSVDLSASAMAQINMLANLESQLISMRTRIEVLKGSLDEDAPSIIALERKSAALEYQISQKSGGLRITGQSNELASLLSNQEELESKKIFAEKSYTSAMASLESARIDASRNQRYLAIYTQPSLPEYPIYPKRFLYSLLTFCGLSVLWGICRLLIASIQDHFMSGWTETNLNNNNSLRRKFDKFLKTPHAFFDDSSNRIVRFFRIFFRN